MLIGGREIAVVRVALGGRVGVYLDGTPCPLCLLATRTTARAELVPGPRWSPPIETPHVLVLGDRYDDGRDWEVEHPPDCGRACPWWPEACTGLRGGFEGTPTCYVEWEIDGAGLDSLSGEVYGIQVESDGWRSLPDGRYLLEGWYTPQGWAGSEPIDADGGLILVGPERPRWYDRLRRSRLRADLAYLRRRARRLRTAGLGLNVPYGRVSLRGPANRTYYSERNRHGCVVLPLRGGWRIVVQRRRTP